MYVYHKYPLMFNHSTTQIFSSNLLSRLIIIIISLSLSLSLSLLPLSLSPSPSTLLYQLLIIRSVRCSPMQSLAVLSSE